MSIGSIVLIIVSDSSGREIKTGSGFIVSSDGQIVTNYHVISGGHSAKAKLGSGAFFEVEGALAVSRDDDLAILKVAGTQLPALPLGDSDALTLGEHVVSIGSPLGLSGSVSDGIVSGLREEAGARIIQTTAPASPGNSGGPLLNMSGQAIGVIAFKLRGGENLNFAVPIKAVRRLLDAGGQVRPLDSPVSPASRQNGNSFKFAPGQAVYVVASQLQLERKARDEFNRQKRYRVVNALKDADFVFAAILDPASNDFDEVALVVLPSDYQELWGQLDALRNKALWQGHGHLHRGKETALVVLTLGYGNLFRSVVKSLVQDFHREIR